MAGLALIGILVGYFGADAVFRSLLAVGWAGFLTICLIHLALMAAMGIAWWVLLPGTRLWSRFGDVWCAMRAPKCCRFRRSAVTCSGPGRSLSRVSPAPPLRRAPSSTSVLNSFLKSPSQVWRSGG